MRGLFGLGRRSIENPAVPLTSNTLLQMIGSGISTAAGVTVTEQSSLSMSAVWRATSLVSSLGASLPLHVLNMVTHERVDNRLLADPHPEMTHYDLWKLCYVHRCLWGNSYHFKRKDGAGRIEQLLPIMPWQVRVGKARRSVPGNPTRKVFDVTFDDGSRDTFTPNEILHIPGLNYDGITGCSPVRAASAAIGLAQAAEEASSRLFSSGNMLGGVLQTEQRLDQEQAETLQERWASKFSGIQNAHKVAVLDSGAEFQSMTMPSVDAEQLECTTAETLLSMSDGTRRRADELLIGHDVQAWDGEKLVPARVVDVFPMPVKPTLRVTVQTGQELTTTGNHPYWASRRGRTPGGRYPVGGLDKHAQWVTADHLCVGDYVRLGVEWSFTPSILSREHAWSTGALLGDGALGHADGRVEFTNPDAPVVDRLRRWVRSFGGDLRSYGRPVQWTLATGGVGRAGSELRKWLSETGLLGQRGVDKRVPDAVMRGGPDAWAGLVSGYLDTDGTVSAVHAPQPQAVWSSISRRLLDDVQHILLMLGVRASLKEGRGPTGPKTTRGREATAKPYWVLTVSGRANVARLAGLVDLSHPEKAARLAHWATDGSRSNGVKSDVRWARVVDVADAGEQATIGVTVAGCHTHVTNGLVTHNSRGFSITELARFFGVPPYLMFQTDKNSSWASGLESQANGFIKFDLHPQWLAPVENRITKELLFNPKVEARYKMEGLLRGDTMARAEFYRVMREAGVFSVNDIRDLEDMTAVEDGDERLRPMNLVPLGTTLEEISNAQGNSEPGGVGGTSASGSQSSGPGDG